MTTWQPEMGQKTPFLGDAEQGESPAGPEASPSQTLTETEPGMEQRGHADRAAVWPLTMSSQCCERSPRSDREGGEMGKGRAGVLGIGVSICPLCSSLPREPSGGTRGRDAARQPAASSPGIPRIAAEFAESYYS